jgi:hypothetical protein
MRVAEVIPPSSHLRFTASQGKLDWNLAESQNLERESGENSRRKLQNVVTDSTAFSRSVTLVLTEVFPQRVHH